MGKAKSSTCAGLPALIENVQLTPKNWSGTNALAYFVSLSVTKKKSFITMTPGRLFRLPAPCYIGIEGFPEGEKEKKIYFVLQPCKSLPFLYKIIS